MTASKENGAKRAYAAPKLKMYGDMISMTKNQSGSLSESGPGTPMGITTMA